MNSVLPRHAFALQVPEDSDAANVFSVIGRKAPESIDVKAVEHSSQQSGHHAYGADCEHDREHGNENRVTYGEQILLHSNHVTELIDTVLSEGTMEGLDDIQAIVIHDKLDAIKKLDVRPGATDEERQAVEEEAENLLAQSGLLAGAVHVDKTDNDRVSRADDEQT